MLNVMKPGLIRVTLNAGLMKPRKGFTLVAGEEKMDVGKPGLQKQDLF